MRRAEAVGADFDARRSATGRGLPLPGLERPGARPAAGPAGLARARPARPRLHADRLRRPAGHATTSAPSAAGRSGPTPAEPLVRRVTTARWSVDEGPEATRRRRRRAEATRLLRFEIAAGSFCHQMVRSLVGSLVEVGRGKENAAGLHGAPAGGLPPPHARSGPGARPVPGLGRPTGPAAAARPPEPVPADQARRLAPPCQGPYPGTSALGTPGTLSPPRDPGPEAVSPTTRIAKDRSCAHIFTEGHRDPAEPGTSSTPTASSSGAWPRRWRPSCAASTAPTSPPTSTPATT